MRIIIPIKKPSIKAQMPYQRNSPAADIFKAIKMPAAIITASITPTTIQFTAVHSEIESKDKLN